MAARKTWVWVVVTVLALGLVGLIAVAGAGVYFVSRHIKTERSTSIEALKSFETVRSSLPNPQPLFEFDEDERPRAVRPLAQLPTSASKPEQVQLLAWDPDEERIIRASLPLWMIRFGKGRMHLGKDRRGFELEQLGLDAGELERIGPALLFDVRNHDGGRLLLWTE